MESRFTFVKEVSLFKRVFVTIDRESGCNKLFTAIESLVWAKGKDREIKKINTK